MSMLSDDVTLFLDLKVLMNFIIGLHNLFKLKS